MLDHLQFAISCWWIIPAILFLKYVYVYWYQQGLRLQSASLDHRLVLFASHKYWASRDIYLDLRDQKRLCYHCATLQLLILKIINFVCLWVIVLWQFICFRFGKCYPVRFREFFVQIIQQNCMFAQDLLLGKSSFTAFVNFNERLQIIQVILWKF